MMPGTLSIITDAFPAHERGKAMGTWAGVSALALAIGPVLGGLLTEHVSWRAIFYLNIPVAIGAVAATLFAVRESRDTSVGKEVDYLGVATLTAGLTALVLALVEGNSWGWGSVRDRRAAGRLGRRRWPPSSSSSSGSRRRWSSSSCSRDRNFLGASIVALIITFAMMGVFFFLALYMQNILGYSPLEAGVRFLPSTLMIVAVAPISGRLADRFGPRWLIVGGLTLLTASLLSFTRIAVDSTYVDLLPGFMLLGIGIAMTMSPMTSAAMNAVAVQKAGVASGVLSMFRMVGGSLGVAVTGAIFQGAVGRRLRVGDPAGIRRRACNRDGRLGGGRRARRCVGRRACDPSRAQAVEVPPEVAEAEVEPRRRAARRPHRLSSLRRIERRPASRVGQVELRQRLDPDPAERGDRLAVRRLDRARDVRPGREDDHRDLEPGARAPPRSSAACG